MNGAPQASGWLWFATILAAFLIGVSIWVGTAVSVQQLEKNVFNERAINSEYFTQLESSAWDKSAEITPFASLSKLVNERVANSKDIIENQKGFVENVIDETPLKLSMYGLLLDYRLSLIILLLPTLSIFFLAVIIDALVSRKVKTYQNSFSSPLRHTLGGRVLGINTTILVIFLFFLPITIPFTAILAIVAIKITGWWIWAANLPKRM